MKRWIWQPIGLAVGLGVVLVVTAENRKFVLQCAIVAIPVALAIHFLIWLLFGERGRPPH